MNQSGIHLIIALVFLIFIALGGTLAILNLNAGESIDEFNKSVNPRLDLNATDNNVSPDQNPPLSDIREDKPPVSVDDLNLSDCDVIFANNPNEYIAGFGAAFCLFESTVNGWVSSVGIDPIHLYFGLLILVLVLLLLSYSMTIMSSKATWIMLLLIVVVFVLFFFRIL